MAAKIKIDADAHPERESSGVIQKTGKYDRKQIKARMVVEGYIEESLREICGSAEPDIELDFDDLEAVPAADRAAHLEAKLAGAKNKADVPYFIKSVLKKLDEFLAEYPSK